MKNGLQDTGSYKPFSWRIVPDGENKCIWMNAGIVEYKLCDRKFDCEDCPLDQDLRLPQPVTKLHRVGMKDEVVMCDAEAAESIIVQHILQPYRTYHVRNDVKYTTSHLWMKSLSPHECTVGIDDFFARLLPKQFSIVLTTNASKVNKGDAIGWIQVNSFIIQLPSPCSGIVTRTNSHLVDNRHLIYESPYDEGWLAIIDTKSNTIESPKYVTSDLMKTHVHRDGEKILHRFSHELHRHNEALGETMNDGGIPMRMIEEALGLHTYIKIIKWILR